VDTSYAIYGAINLAYITIDPIQKIEKTSLSRVAIAEEPAIKANADKKERGRLAVNFI
jgi:hypothetical protein